jgi:hypothetical protein
MAGACRQAAEPLAGRLDASGAESPCWKVNGNTVKRVLPERGFRVDAQLPSHSPLPAGAEGDAPPPAVRRWLRSPDLLYPVLLLVITIGFFWKITLTRQFTWLDQPDLVNQVMPWLQFQAAEWHRGHLALWDPRAFVGQPLAGQVQPGTLNPLNWLLFAAPLKDGFIPLGNFNWYFVLIHYLGAVLFYRLCRDLRLSPAASLLAGCAFGLGGFVGIVMWPQILLSAVWMPLVLMFFLRVTRGERLLASAAWCGALMGFSLLGTHHNVPVFFGVALGGLWLYFLVAPGGQERRWRMLAAGLFALCFLLVASPQILSARELGQWSFRWVGASAPITWDQRVPYFVHDQYSFYPNSVLGIVIPGIFRHTDPYIGLVVVCLALIGTVARWEKPAVRVFLGLAAWGLFFSLGSAFFLHGVLYAVLPALHMARNPSMGIAVFHLGVVGLAAFGLDACRVARKHFGKLVWPLAGLSALLYVAVTLFVTVRPEKGQEYYHLTLTALAALVLACIFAAWSRSAISQAWASGLLILVMLLEVGNISTAGYKPLDQAVGVKKLYQNRDIARYLQTRGEPVRVSADCQDFPCNFGDWFGVDQLDGYAPGVVRSVLAAFGNAQLERLLSVGYHAGHAPNGNRQAEVFVGASGLKVYRDAGAFPRVRTVHAVRTLPREADLAPAVADPASDLRSTVLLTGPAPSLQSCAGADRLAIQESTPNQISLDVQMACTGMVIVSDSWFPGWKAEVDGQSAEIHRAYGLIRGVVVAGGSHRLRMSYRPVILYAGAGLAVAGFMICAGLQWAARRREYPST